MDNLHQYLFIDIETVSGKATYDELTLPMQEYWVKKTHALKLPTDVTPHQSYKGRAAIYSEFAKVVCISLGCLIQKDGDWKIYLKSLTGHDEQELLTRFCKSLGQFLEREKELIFCGHNIKEFDLPFLSRRMVIHGMDLPTA